jgi:lysophospholipase L1-like esterase
MPASQPTSLNVLFIGNSFTARNNLPKLIAELAQARGLRLEHRLISAGGASLRMHWNKGEAPAAIREGGFDHVVLQEQSTLPVKNAARMHENVRLFDQVIRAAGAKTTLYMTWARQHSPDAQQAITDAYASIAREIHATLVPVGVAWQKLLQQKNHPNLYDKDQSHPSPAGSYLAACVFFGVLFGQSAVGVESDLPGLKVSDIKLLQRAAQSVLKEPSPAPSLR